MSRPVRDFVIGAVSMAGVELFGGPLLAVRNPSVPQVLFECVLTGVILATVLHYRRLGHPPD